MPKGLFHAVVLTDDFDATMRFLTDICRIGPVRPYEPAPASLAAALGWPEAEARTQGAIVGEPPGMLDVVGIPPELRDRVQPGVALLAIATPDVEGRVAAARAAGFTAQEPRRVQSADGTGMTMAPLAVGGVGFEFVRFETG